MPVPEEPNAPVRAKAVLIDPESMTVLWMNEAAAQDHSGGSACSVVGTSVAEAVPLADTLGIPEALCKTAETGEAQHLRADLVSTSRGSVLIVASVYRLPDGRLLLLMEHGWQATQAASAQDRARRPSRRTR